MRSFRRLSVLRSSDRVNATAASLKLSRESSVRADFDRRPYEAPQALERGLPSPGGASPARLSNFQKGGRQGERSAGQRLADTIDGLGAPRSSSKRRPRPRRDRSMEKPWLPSRRLLQPAPNPRTGRRRLLRRHIRTRWVHVDTSAGDAVDSRRRRPRSKRGAFTPARAPDRRASRA
jgi:hypothetical protein